VATGSGLLLLPVRPAFRAQRDDATTHGGLRRQCAGGLRNCRHVLLFLFAVQPGGRHGDRSVRRKTRHSDRRGAGRIGLHVVRQREHLSRVCGQIPSRRRRRFRARRRRVPGHAKFSSLCSGVVYRRDTDVRNGGRIGRSVLRRAVDQEWPAVEPILDLRRHWGPDHQRVPAGFPAGRTETGRGTGLGIEGENRRAGCYSFPQRFLG